MNQRLAPRPPRTSPSSLACHAASRQRHAQVLVFEVPGGLIAKINRPGAEYPPPPTFPVFEGPFNNTAYEPGNPRNFKTIQDDYMWTGGGSHGRFLMNVILTPLNVFNIGLSSFTLLLFIVVRCPVTYQNR